jgi:hypothetical protein
MRLTGLSKIRSFGFTTRARRISTWTLFLSIGTIWIVYLLIGRQLITVIYDSEVSWIASKFMGGRASTPVEAYYRQADAVLLRGTLWLVTAYLALLLLLHNAQGSFLFAFSLLLSSFLFFWFFETFPSLIKPFHLDAVFGYYAYKANYIPDPELGFREKPFNKSITHGFRGNHYSSRYGIEIPPMTIEWIMDKDGFRNGRATDSAEVVVLGDSFLEYGDNQADTFTGRLEKRLPGLTVKNLGKSGYAPFQYLEALKRFGLGYKPRYALMAFFEGNDIQETREYLLWKSGKNGEVDAYLYRFSTESLLRRYWAAVTATLDGFRKTTRAWGEALLDKIAHVRGYDYDIHPNLAVLNLGGRSYTILFVPKFAKTTTEEMLRTEEFRALKKVFGEFRDVCEANGIKPIILYIPLAVHIYAQYSIEGSGFNWLQIRDGQIAASENRESAVNRLAQEFKIDVMSLTPRFQLATKKNKLIYYSLDSHWNSEGREIAAEFVADMLKSQYLNRSFKKPTTER